MYHCPGWMGTSGGCVGASAGVVAAGGAGDHPSSDGAGATDPPPPLSVCGLPPGEAAVEATTTEVMIRARPAASKSAERAAMSRRSASNISRPRPPDLLVFESSATLVHLTPRFSPVLWFVCSRDSKSTMYFWVLRASQFWTLLLPSACACVRSCEVSASSRTQPPATSTSQTKMPCSSSGARSSMPNLPKMEDTVPKIPPP
mmetsp:Transcript_21951/g.71098  ORF Transcript_21951/g.71098 Transcript_21951/m.71098 type:complete len:202 (+) Transcript_21951:1620-2225(+)